MIPCITFGLMCRWWWLSQWLANLEIYIPLTELIDAGILSDGAVFCFAQGETRLKRALSLRTFFLAFSILAASASFLFCGGLILTIHG
jgi:hypothetical protein